jgi:hypothetical protein
MKTEAITWRAVLVPLAVVFLLCLFLPTADAAQRHPSKDGPAVGGGGAGFVGPGTWVYGEPGAAACPGCKLPNGTQRFQTLQVRPPHMGQYNCSLCDLTSNSTQRWRAR